MIPALHGIIRTARNLIDADAEAFITRANTYSPNIGSTEQSAIRYLVPALKTSGKWADLVRMYPCVGTVNNQQGIDLRTSNLSNSLTWSGGTWTYNSSGFTPPSGGGFANTLYNATGLGSSYAFCFYSVTNNTPATNDSIDFGAYASETARTLISARNGASKNTLLGTASNTAYSATNTDARGLFGVSKTSGTARTTKNGSVVASGSDSGTLPNDTFKIGTIFVAGSPYADGYTNQTYALAAIWSGGNYDATWWSELYPIIQEYQRLLGRNV